MNRRIALPTAIAGAALLIGVGSGVAVGRSVPAQTSVVERTPASCIQAMVLAAEAIEQGNEMVRIATDAIVATRNEDGDTLTRLSGQMGDLKDRMRPMPDKMSPLEADCRAKSK
jgi:hypothetical protein